jgi:23S rRNA pseudouridine2605 synthase
MSVERLQKFLSRAGIASRRHAEELILAGRVRVGGRVVTELGTKVDPKRDRVDVDDKRVVADLPVYIVLHKPRSVMCTMSDPEGRPTVAHLVRNVGARVVPVGRLDFQTSGVLLLTNDGDFAAGLSHPSKQVEKVYVVKVQGKLDDTLVDRFRQSIVIDGRATTPAEVKRLRIENAKTWLEVTLREGRNRQVRRLGEAAGFIVMRLARTAYAGISAEGLRPGEWRPITLEELKDLKANYGVPQRVRGPDLELVDKARVRRRPRAQSAKGPRERSRDRNPFDDDDAPPRRSAPTPGRATHAPDRNPRFDRADATRGRSAPKPPRSPYDRSAGPRDRSAPKPARAAFDKSAGPRDRSAPQPARSSFDRSAAPRGRSAPKPAGSPRGPDRNSRDAGRPKGRSRSGRG